MSSDLHVFLYHNLSHQVMVFDVKKVPILIGGRHDNIHNVDHEIAIESYTI